MSQSGDGGAPSRQSARIRGLRPRVEPADPFRSHGLVIDRERSARGPRATATLFLAGAECPFTCVHCDLFRFATAGAAAPGALVRQVEAALPEISDTVELLKLYNASNFFEPRAVPEADEAAIAEKLDRFATVTVECHPKLLLGDRGWDRCQRFQAALGGELEVAMGLETANATALAQLNKQLALEDFERACERLRAQSIAIRVFVLIGAPFVPEAAAENAVLESAVFALEHGAGVVSLVPVRGGNGELERLAGLGLWHPPTLDLVERSFHRCLGELCYPAGVVLLDEWDLERVPGGCAKCRRQRIDGLRRANRDGATPVVPDGVEGCGCPMHQVGAAGGIS